jgi:hypothetical protein
MEKINKKLIQDNVSIDVTGGVSFTELTNKYSEKVGELMSKYDNVKNIRVKCESHEYNDGENYVENLDIYFDRYETDEECERRISWQNFRKEEIEEKNIKLLKELIAKYPDKAFKYINDIKN